MEKNTFSFVINGKDAEPAAEEIQKIIYEEFDYTPSISVEKEDNPQHRTRSIEQITLAIAAGSFI